MGNIMKRKIAMLSVLMVGSTVGVTVKAETIDQTVSIVDQGVTEEAELASIVDEEVTEEVELVEAEAKSIDVKSSELIKDYINNNVIFGQAQNYSIVVEGDLTINQHVEGNIAVGGDLKEIGNSVCNYDKGRYGENSSIKDSIGLNNIIYGKVEDLKNIGSIGSGNNLGTPAHVYLNPDLYTVEREDSGEQSSYTITNKLDKNNSKSIILNDNQTVIETYDSKQTPIDINDTFDYLKDLSRKMQSITSEQGIEIKDEGNTLEIACNDKSSILEGLYAVTVKLSELCVGNEKTIDVKLNDKQQCIINVDCEKRSEESIVTKTAINGNQEDYNPKASNIIWNFFNGENATICLSNTIGQILAPESNIIVAQDGHKEWKAGNLDGKIIARSLEIYSEIHPISKVNTQNPEDPSDPEDPTDPEDPSDPVDPTDPIDPSDPVDPSDPIDPSDPEDPSNPVDQSTPSDPSTPSNPSTPSIPTPPSNNQVEVPDELVPLSPVSDETISSDDMGEIIPDIIEPAYEIEDEEIPQSPTEVATEKELPNTLPKTGGIAANILTMLGVTFIGLSKKIKS